MFAALFWMSTAILTVLWAATSDVALGAGVVALLMLRLGLLGGVVFGLIVNPDVRRDAQRYARLNPISADVRLGDYAIDLVALSVFGWLAQRDVAPAMPVLVIYVGCVLMWEVMHAIIGTFRK